MIGLREAFSELDAVRRALNAEVAVVLWQPGAHGIVELRVDEQGPTLLANGERVPIDPSATW